MCQERNSRWATGSVILHLWVFLCNVLSCHIFYRSICASSCSLHLTWHCICVVKPRRGDALLFFSLHTNATPDTSSLHAGCPVIEGEKWSATKWIHVDSFDKTVGAGGDCSDHHVSCERWASLGECTKNPEYMIGSSDVPGYCRKSCKSC